MCPLNRLRLSSRVVASLVGFTLVALISDRHYRALRTACRLGCLIRLLPADLKIRVQACYS